MVLSFSLFTLANIILSLSLPHHLEVPSLRSVEKRLTSARGKVDRERDFSSGTALYRSNPTTTRPVPIPMNLSQCVTRSAPTIARTEKSDSLSATETADATHMCDDVVRFTSWPKMAGEIIIIIKNWGEKKDEKAIYYGPKVCVMIVAMCTLAEFCDNQARDEEQEPHPDLAIVREKMVRSFLEQREGILDRVAIDGGHNQDQRECCNHLNQLINDVNIQSVESHVTYGQPIPPSLP